MSLLKKQVCKQGLTDLLESHFRGLKVMNQFIFEQATMPMYFTITEMTDYVKEVMSGAHIWDEGRFYPTGRLASIESINVLYEKEEYA